MEDSCALRKFVDLVAESMDLELENVSDAAFLESAASVAFQFKSVGFLWTYRSWNKIITWAFEIENYYFAWKFVSISLEAFSW